MPVGCVRRAAMVGRGTIDNVSAPDRETTGAGRWWSRGLGIPGTTEALARGGGKRQPSYGEDGVLTADPETSVAPSMEDFLAV